jgi:hypothetical protein
VVIAIFPFESVQVANPVSRDQWIPANLQFGGYFRVSYDTENLNLSAEQLMVNYTVIPAVTRAQLAVNSFVLPHADVLPYDVPVKLIAYLKDNDKKIKYIRNRAIQHLRIVKDMSGNVYLSDHFRRSN